MLKAILPVIRNGYQNILQVKDPIFVQPTRVSQKILAEIQCRKVFILTSTSQYRIRSS